MLMDIIGVVIAFSVVMLLLSLMVTSLSQATQHYLRLRGRNLQHGLKFVLEQEGDRLVDPSVLAANILCDPFINSEKTEENKISLSQKALGPKITWIEPQALKQTLGSEVSDKVAERFQELEEPLKKRFAHTMRKVSIFWAVIFAFGFQISTPELIKELAINSEYRAQLVRGAEGVIAKTEEEIRESSSINYDYSTAINQMVLKHPELQSQLNTLNTNTPWPGELSLEFADLIDDQANVEELIVEFEALLFTDVERQIQEELTNAKQKLDQLSIIDITPYKYGNRFYYSDNSINLRNIIGVLMTVILLTLGAPFWFDILKNAVAFRDLLKPRAGDKK